MCVNRLLYPYKIWYTHTRIALRGTEKKRELEPKNEEKRCGLKGENEIGLGKR